MPQSEPVPAPSHLSRVWRQPKPNGPKANGPKARIHYPVEDGKPMSETIRHRKVSSVSVAALELHHTHRPDACVGGNNFMYYEEGNPRAVLSPDVFVAYGVPKETDRQVWKVWEEGKAPDFILEVTSKTTRREDEYRKKDIYERVGVTEYWQFDPTGDYLDPILKGRALVDGRYRALDLERRDGGLCRFSEVLGLDLRLEEGRLRFFDPERGEYVPTQDEQRQAIEDKDRTVDQQRQALEERDRTVDQQHQALEGMERTVDQQRQALEERDRTVDRLHQALEERDRTVGQQHQALEGMERTVDQQRQALEERDRTIDQQNQALEERDLTVDRLHQALEGMERTIDQQRRSFEAAEARIRRLERERRPDG